MTIFEKLPLEHRTCKGKVKLEARVVATLPCDVMWPKDTTIKIPYCTGCKRPVDLSEVEAYLEFKIDGAEMMRTVAEQIGGLDAKVDARLEDGRARS